MSYFALVMATKAFVVTLWIILKGAWDDRQKIADYFATRKTIDGGLLIAEKPASASTPEKPLLLADLRSKPTGSVGSVHQG